MRGSYFNCLASFIPVMPKCSPVIEPNWDLVQLQFHADQTQLIPGITDILDQYNALEHNVQLH